MAVDPTKEIQYFIAVITSQTTVIDNQNIPFDPPDPEPEEEEEEVGNG